MENDEPAAYARAMQPVTRHLNLFADYFQFYVCDDAYTTDTATIWDEVTTDRMLAVWPDLVAVGTARNMDVPVEIAVRGEEPRLEIDQWDQVIQCGLSVPSGKLLVIGCTETRDEASHIEIPPGNYRVRVSYASLTDLSDNGLDGNDRYRVELWPGEASVVEVLKRRRD